MKETIYPNIYDALNAFLANKEVDIYSDLRSLAENLIDSIDNNREAVPAYLINLEISTKVFELKEQDLNSIRYDILSKITKSNV